MPAAITPEQNRLNLRSAERIVAAEMGVDPDLALGYEQRTEFSQRLAAVVLKYPERFTDETIRTAKLIKEKNYAAIADDSFNWSDFTSAAAENAIAIGDSVADVGRGAQAAVSQLRWILPVMLVAGAAFVLLNWKKRLTE